MESEEQKPPDLFLNSEVKSEKIGANPLPDDECSGLNIQKLEEIDNSDYSIHSEKIDDSLEKEIKMEELEEIDGTDYSRISEQKSVGDSKKYDNLLKRKVKTEEPEKIDNPDYSMNFDQKTGNFEQFGYPHFAKIRKHSEGFVVPKLEKVDDLWEKEVKLEEPENQKIKEEPPDYDSLKAPTLQPVESSSTMINRDSTCQLGVFPIEKSRHWSIYTHRCSLCSSIQALLQIKQLERDIDRLVIGVGRILSGESNLAQGKEFFEQSSHTKICKRHFPEAINQIYEVLNIKECDEIATCPVQRVNDLMSIVNSISPLITSEEFIESLKEFPKKSAALMEKPRLCGPMECVLCYRWRPRSLTRYVRSRYERTILMLGRILAKKNTVDEAKMIMEKKGFRVCTNHLTENVDDICRHLNIKELKQLCGNVSKLEKSLIVVQSFLPCITLNGFIRTIDWFILNIHYEHISNKSFESKKSDKTNQLRNSSDESTALCRVCSSVKSCSEMKFVNTEEDIIVIIGQVLMKNYSIERAKHFLIQSKYAYICHVHFHEAIDRISTFLNIEKPERNAICSKYKMKSLENMINDLSPNLKYSPIQEVIQSFDTRNQEILNGIPSTTPNLPKHQSDDC